MKKIENGNTPEKVFGSTLAGEKLVEDFRKSEFITFLEPSDLDTVAIGGYFITAVFDIRDDSR